MTERHFFRCDICGAEFNRIEEALECEGCHQKPVGIKEPVRRYGSFESHPYEIEVLFESGAIATYKLKQERMW